MGSALYLVCILHKRDGKDVYKRQPPVLEEYKAHLYYKILYLMEFYNQECKETKYMVLDSLTGDLEKVMESE